ncbi:hypothetical protein ACHWQZ_G004065 [Mnemiopsis leidyi]
MCIILTQHTQLNAVTMTTRSTLIFLLCFCSNLVSGSWPWSRRYGRRCYYCPKPLASSIKQCMGTVSEMESEITARLGEEVSLETLELPREEFLEKRSPDLAKELMSTFASVRCYAIMLKNFFSTVEIQKINDIALSLTEINRNPKVCVFDNFMTDCQTVDTRNVTSLQAQLQKQWLILDVLLEKVGDEK